MAEPILVLPLGYSLGFGERFWAKVKISGPDECWPWRAARNRGGYGVIGRGRRGEGNVLAHVAAYELTIGPKPAGSQLDHLCRNTGCVNPAHLEAVPQRENLRRQSVARTTCRAGHPYTAENTRPSKRGRVCRTCVRRWRRAEA